MALGNIIMFFLSYVWKQKWSINLLCFNVLFFLWIFIMSQTCSSSSASFCFKWCGFSELKDPDDCTRSFSIVALIADLRHLTCVNSCVFTSPQCPGLRSCNLDDGDGTLFNGKHSCGGLWVCVIWCERGNAYRVWQLLSEPQCSCTIFSIHAIKREPVSSNYSWLIFTLVSDLIYFSPSRRKTTFCHCQQCM